MSELLVVVASCAVAFEHGGGFGRSLFSQRAWINNRLDLQSPLHAFRCWRHNLRKRWGVQCEHECATTEEADHSITQPTCAFDCQHLKSPAREILNLWFHWELE